MHISVIGLGKLGAPLAAVLASKGHTVIGLDINESYVQCLNEGRAPVEEPRLQELIDTAHARLTATTDYDAAVGSTEATFIITPTPSDEAGAFSNKYVLAAIESVGNAIRKKADDNYHLVVVTSTVMPGSMDQVIQDRLEFHSGRKVGETLGLCYNPEFIALGSVIQDMLAPDMLLIGESDAQAGDRLEDLYRTICDNTPAVRRMNFVNAELTKIAVNTFVTTKISYANMLAGMCDRIPNADADVVAAALGSDSRIGAKYLKAALGYGGPCFPRDNIAFAALARQIGSRADLADATDRINLHQVERITDAVKQRAESGAVIGILGLSYKPDTSVIEESQGIMIAKSLSDSGYSVVVYDPQATGSAMAVLGHSVQPSESAADCAQAADLTVIVTPWPEFKEIPPEAFERSGVKAVIIDCWRMLPAERFAGIADIVYPGRHDPRPLKPTMLAEVAS